MFGVGVPQTCLIWPNAASTATTTIAAILMQINSIVEAPVCYNAAGFMIEYPRSTSGGDCLIINHLFEPRAYAIPEALTITILRKYVS